MALDGIDRAIRHHSKFPEGEWLLFVAFLSAPDARAAHSRTGLCLSVQNRIS
jgi:hypothetical protein